jgi:hypothetical protein
MFFSRKRYVLPATLVSSCGLWLRTLLCGPVVFRVCGFHPLRALPCRLLDACVAPRGTDWCGDAVSCNVTGAAHGWQHSHKGPNKRTRAHAMT